MCINVYIKYYTKSVHTMYKNDPLLLKLEKISNLAKVQV